MSSKQPVGDYVLKSEIPSMAGLATEDYVDGKVADIINSAPETLDTLNELAAALGDDPNFATTVATQIGNKVDKVVGKGLSTNDFTNEYKTKLDGLENMTFEESDPTVPAWAKAENKPTYTANEVGADAVGTAQGLIDGLNVKNGEGDYSVVAGLGNVAKSEAEFVVGKYNKTIGNGYKTVTSSYYEDYGVDLPTLTVTRDSIPSLNDSGTFDITEEFADQAYRQVYSWFSRGSDICIILSETSYVHVSDMDYTGAGYSGSFISGTRYDIMPNIIELSFSIGNGTSDTERSNAHTLDWNGNAWYQGNVYVGGTDQDNGSEKLMTQSEVMALLASILPTPTAADAGKILRVNAEGKYELVALPNAEEATF